MYGMRLKMMLTFGIFFQQEFPTQLYHKSDDFSKIGRLPKKCKTGLYVHTYVSEKQSSFTKEHLELQVGLLELCLGLPELFCAQFEEAYNRCLSNIVLFAKKVC